MRAVLFVDFTIVSNFLSRYRVQAQLEALGARPMEQTLALLRQLKYSENVMFAGKKDPYADSITYGYEEQTHADVEMILLDLL